MQSLNITFWGVAFAVLLLAVPAYLLWRVNPKFSAKGGAVVARTVAQLACVAIYLHFLFLLDSVAVDALWLVAMATIGAYVTSGRLLLRRSVVLVPMIVGQVVAVAVVTLYLLLLVFRPADSFNARWLVPVAGLLLCGVQTIDAETLKAFYDTLYKERNHYYFLLGNGATHREAVMPFVSKAVERAYAPALRYLALVGLVAVPELTYALALCGISAIMSVAYTAIILCATVTVSAVSLFLTLYIADRRTFDVYGRVTLVTETT